MSHAVTIITEQVRERVRREGVDLGADRELADRYTREEVQRYSERALGGSLPMLADEQDAARQIVATITGFGALQPFFDDQEIEEIWINGPDRVFVARNGLAERTDVRLTDTQVRDLVERMLQSSGRRVDLSSPFVDASLPDGSRLHVVIPDVTRRHWAVNVRKFSQRIGDLRRLVALGSLTQQAAEFLRMCVLSGQNVLVSGATQSGNVLLLATFSAEDGAPISKFCGAVWLIAAWTTTVRYTGWENGEMTEAKPPAGRLVADEHRPGDSFHSDGGHRIVQIGNECSERQTTRVR